jgi:predicted transposase/invertase (TIGR01784 family)
VKTEPIVDKPVEEMTNAEQWAVFFQYLTDEERRGKIIEIINREEGIAMAVETLGTFTQSELDYIRESGRIKAELDYRADMKDAMHKSHAEGRNEASFDIARKMKIMGFLTEQIQAATGLPIETITQL